MRRAGPISLLLITSTLAAYWPLSQAEFINFDDPLYVTENPAVSHGLSWHGVVWAFTAVHASNWHPLTWLSHMADCSIFGANPMGPHLVNVGFHIANSLLLLALLWRMTRAPWRSAFVAALFALHPLHVESVAWISERKDVLSSFFGLMALLAYTAYVTRVENRVDGDEQSKVRKLKSESQGPAARKITHAGLWYALALTFFAMGLMSKPMLVTLPFVMLLLDFWPLGGCRSSIAKGGDPGEARHLQGWQSTVRRGRFVSSARAKLPFFGLPIASSVVTFWAQKTSGAVATMETIPPGDRLANAANSYATYLAKAFWPTNLALPYPFVLNLPAMRVALAVGCLLGATALAVIAARRAPYLLVGWLWFVGMLVPVIGLVQVGGQAMADRYAYLPLIGVFVMGTWGAVALTARWRVGRVALPIIAVVILTGCFLATRRQAAYWRSSLRLFTHAVEVTKDNAVAEEKLGYTLALAGNRREALQHFNAALRLSPTYQVALVNRAHTLSLEGRKDEAIADYGEAIRTQVVSNEAAYFQLAGLLAQQQKWDEAKTNYMLALRCNPDSAEAHTKLGNLLWRQTEHAAAMIHLYEAVRLRPDYADAQYNLGNALAQQRKSAEAAGHLRAAIKADPNCAPALNDLAWILATENDPAIRNVPEGVRLAQQACELTRNQNAWLMDTLGVAESEAGEFRQAIRITERAAALADAAGDEQTAAGLRRRLASYRKGKAYHLNPR